MSGKRQVRTLAVGYPSGRVVAAHSHSWDQLVYGVEGVMSVTTEAGVWVVQAGRALWVPAGMRHEILATGFVSMRTLYTPPAAAEELPRACCVVQVGGLLRELILHCVGLCMTLGVLDEGDPDHGPAVTLLFQQLRDLRQVPMVLPSPSDERARRVAAALREAPADAVDLDALCLRAGASRRTIERLFSAETGLTLGRWRTQLRLLHALPRLAAGEPVTQVAFAVGYESPSAFIEQFKRSFGATPGRYYAGPSDA